MSYGFNSWSNGTERGVKVDRPDFNDVKDVLRKKFKSEPSDYDVMWHILAKDSLEHAKNGQWGLYRNDVFLKADVLNAKGSKLESITYYLCVCYLDLNDPENVGIIKDASLRKEYPAFKADMDGILPYIVNLIKNVNAHLNLSESEFKEIFYTHVVDRTKSLRLPVKLDMAWDEIRFQLKKGEVIMGEVAVATVNEAVKKGSDEKFCADCGAVINAKAEICPKCGVRQISAPTSFGGTAPNGKSKIAAALFALFLGGFGGHKFYLGQTGKGFLYLIFFWTFIPALIATVEMILLFTMSDETFAQKYGRS